MGVKTNLRDELNNEIHELSKVEFGSKEYEIGVKGVTLIADRVIELERLENENAKLDIEQQKVDIETQRLEDERKDRKAKNGISVAGIAIPAGITVVGGIAMFIFEERGSILGQASRKIVDRIFRMK